MPEGWKWTSLSRKLFQLRVNQPGTNQPHSEDAQGHHTGWLVSRQLRAAGPVSAHEKAELQADSQRTEFTLDNRAPPQTDKEAAWSHNVRPGSQTAYSIFFSHRVPKWAWPVLLPLCLLS